MQLNARREPRFNPIPIAAGFAIGCAALGVGARAITAMTRGVPTTDEGGALADVAYAAAAYVPLALSGAVAFAIVGLIARRWLRRWRVALAFMTGGWIGAAVAGMAAFGWLREWMPFAVGPWAPVFYGLILGIAAGMVVTLLAAALHRSRL